MKLEKLTNLLLIILLLTGLSFGLTGCKDKQSQTKQVGSFLRRISEAGRRTNF